MKHNGTVNRGWLKKQISAGNAEIKKDMILTDDYAFDVASKNQKSDFKKANISDFCDDDFTFPDGRATWKSDGTINWRMLTNHYYTVRLIKQ